MSEKTYSHALAHLKSNQICVVASSNNCIFIIMSVYLEAFLKLHPGSKYLFTEDEDPKGPNRLKGKYASDVRDNVWRTDDFVALAPEASPLDKNGWPSDIGTPTVAASVRPSTPPIVVELSWKWKYVAAGKASKEAG